MSSAIEFDIDIARMMAKIEKVPDLVFDEMRRGLVIFAAGFQKEFIRKRMRNDWETHSGEGVGTRTGALRRTLTFKMGGTTLNTIFAKIKIGGGPARKYARMQEEGNKRAIVPTSAKRLKIPLRLALTKAGVVKKAAQSKTLDLLFGKKRGGVQNLFLGRKAKGKRGKAKYYWILKKSIPAGAIKPRLGFYDFFATYRVRAAKKMINSASRRITKKINAASFTGR